MTRLRRKTIIALKRSSNAAYDWLDSKAVILIAVMVVGMLYIEATK